MYARRGLVLLIVLVAALAACAAPPAAPSATGGAAAPGASAAARPASAAAAASDGWEAEWAQVLAAAKREGVVVVMGPPGDSIRTALTEFQRAYPDIRLEYSGAFQQEWSPRMLAEREAGQFLWDVHIGGTGSPATQWAPKGVLDPLKPALVRPEVLDDSNWLNGFDWGFIDAAQQHVFAPAANLNYSINVNRDVIPAGELTTVDDLLDPRYKGKISINEPREFSAGALHSAVLSQALGADRFRRVLAEQDVSVHRDTRQQVELLVRGARPIAIGASTPQLTEFKKQGLGLNVRPLELTEASAISPGNAGCACLMNRAPHPNAARVYLDWFLSREGQAAWNKGGATNSRRLDVEPADAATMPKPGVDYLYIEREQNLHLRAAAMELAKEALP
ncbi:MAG TPA: extracellular solute-binding protein [Chloroflexota bacterium]|jgi:iron(III) transport system substrate-binding protein